MAARASGSQCGAPRPTNAGTRYTPPVSLDAGRERLALAGVADQLDAITQPLQGGAGDEDAALERVGGLAGEAIGDRGEQAVARRDRRRAGVQQREAAGAVGALQHARREARLADGRRLLIAGDAGDRHRRAEQARRGGAERRAAVPDLRQNRPWNAQEPEQLVVPVLAMDVVEHRARGVARVGGMHLAAGETPEQERIDGAERQLAALGRLPRARDLVEQPGELGRGEVRIDHQAGARPHQGIVAGGAERAAALGGAPVLPHDRAVHRLTARPLPQHHGLALVGDTERGDVCGLQPRLGQRFATDRDRVLPDGLGIMLDPAGAWVVLRELALALRDRRARPIEHDGARAGGALIDRQDVTRWGHAPPPRDGDPLRSSLSPRSAARQRRGTRGTRAGLRMLEAVPSGHLGS